MGCAIAAELAGLVPEFGLVVLVLRAVRTVTLGCLPARLHFRLGFPGIELWAKYPHKPAKLLTKESSGVMKKSQAGVSVHAHLGQCCPFVHNLQQVHQHLVGAVR
jgi:hypothetical protein